MAIVRNPFDRIVSAYYYLHKGHKKRFGSFPGFVKGLRRMLENPSNGRYGSIYTPQFLYTHIGVRQVADFVMRFECLDSDFRRLCALLNVELELQRVNTGTSPERPDCATRELYTAEAVATIRELYRDDFLAHGYDPNPPGTR